MESKRSLRPIIVKFLSLANNLELSQNELEQITTYLNSDKFHEQCIELQRRAKSQKQFNQDVTMLFSNKLIEIDIGIENSNRLNEILKR